MGFLRQPLDTDGVRCFTTPMTTRNTVIAGPAGHWYALSRYEGRDFLVGRPMSADEDLSIVPEHPDVLGDAAWDEWYEITDPAPETDVAELMAKLA